MTFTFRENFENFDPSGFEGMNTAAPPPAETKAEAKDEKIQIFAEKLRLPEMSDLIGRSRLDRLLRRSLEQVGAVLITGRAGTGKTSLAANFARSYDCRVWYRVEAADADWKIFSSHLSNGIRGNCQSNNDLNIRDFIDKLLAESASPKNAPRLIVLDDIHHVFDAEWFHEFFPAILQAISPATHLIFLSRGKPSFPLWRLRSKQILTVIDEKIIAFDEMETAAFCQREGIPPDECDRIYTESFGRIGKLKAMISAG